MADAQNSLHLLENFAAMIAPPTYEIQDESSWSQKKDSLNRELIEKQEELSRCIDDMQQRYGVKRTDELLASGSAAWRRSMLCKRRLIADLRSPAAKINIRYLLCFKI